MAAGDVLAGVRAGDPRALATGLAGRGLPGHFCYRLPGVSQPILADLASEPLLRP